MSLFDSIKYAFNNNPFAARYKINRMRPPGAVEEERFIKLCIRCSRCVEVCPYRTLKRSGSADIGDIGTPFIYAEENACKLCTLCTSVCPTGALDPKVQEREQVDIGKARVDEDQCYNYRALNYKPGDPEPIMCNTCFNVCPLRHDAIYLEDGLVPVITQDCTGCGICVERCPNEPKAISIIPKDMPDVDSAGYLQFLKRSSKK